MKVGVYSPVGVIKAANKASGDSPLVILDSPPGTSCPFIQTVVQSDYVILVTEPTPFGLSDLKQSVETLKTLKRLMGLLLIRLVLEIKMYINTWKIDIPLLMEIPFDKEIASCYSIGEIYASNKKKWQNELTAMIKTIISNNGNSNN